MAPLTAAFTLDPSQVAAVKVLTSSRVAVMTGGPGTGKTTTLRAVLDELEAQGVEVELCAPTGKAAKRMSESTGRPSRTVHRLLKFDPETGGFVHDGDNTLDAGAVIVDEASMLDIELFASLIEAIPERGRLLLVGDADQLPSVGPGQVLADLVGSDVVPVARLTTLHRSAAESWVCRNAPRIIAGDMPELQQCVDFDFLDCETPDTVAAEVVAAVHADPAAQVLTPQNTGSTGTHALNRAIQTRINGPQTGRDSVRLGEGADVRELRVGDRVIHTKNDYKLEVFNGEVGTVLRIANGAPVVDFGDRVVEYGDKSALVVALAYALTIHKSQGSEFDHAIVIAHSTHMHMLARQLFYTAITRAKKRVTIIGNLKGISAALGAGDSPRNSTLIERVREASE